MFLKPFFPRDEFESRWRKAARLIEQRRLDAVLITNPGNQFWLCGFQGPLSSRKIPEFSHEVVFPRILIRRNEDPILIGIDMARDTYASETHIADVRTCDAARLPESRCALIANSVAKRENRTCRIGVDFGAYESITVVEFDCLKKALPGAEWIDVSEAFSWLRMIKSAREIDALREAVRIQDMAFQLFFGEIELGLSEVDLVWAMAKCQAAAGATEMGMAMPWTHPGYLFFRQQYADRTMCTGDLQWFDAGSTYHGYNSDYAAIISYGEPSRAATETFTKLREVYEEGLSHFIPGRPVVQIAQNVLSTIQKHGCQDPLNGAFIGHNLGYDMVEKPWLGVNSPPDLCLEPGMVMAPEWFVVTPYGPIIYEENFLVTADGLERLTGFPREIQVVA